MRHTATTSSLNCRWIRRSTVREVEGINYGVCRRLRQAERVVSELECEACPWWERPLSGADARVEVLLNVPPAREASWGGRLSGDGVTVASPWLTCLRTSVAREH